MSDAAGWCLIESDPGVFTELIRELGNFSLNLAFVRFRVWMTRLLTYVPCVYFVFVLGVTGAQVEELWTLDSSLFETIK